MFGGLIIYGRNTYYGTLGRKNTHTGILMLVYHILLCVVDCVASSMSN